MRERGIIESYKLKRQVVSSASEAAEMILRVDDIIRSAPRSVAAFRPSLPVPGVCEADMLAVSLPLYLGPTGGAMATDRVPQKRV